MAAAGPRRRRPRRRGRSQRGAASSIIASGADVAALGGFSGRESEVSVSWLAEAVRDGRISWVVADSGGGMGGDGRTGSSTVMAAVELACTPVSLPSSSSSDTTAGGSAFYDCRGKADELATPAS